MATAGLSGTAASINDDMPFLNALLRTPAATSQSIYFVKGQSLASAGTTPNQAAVGGALDLLPLSNSLFAQLATLGLSDGVTALQS